MSNEKPVRSVDAEKIRARERIVDWMRDAAKGYSLLNIRQRNQAEFPEAKHAIRTRFAAARVIEPRSPVTFPFRMHPMQRTTRSATGLVTTAHCIMATTPHLTSDASVSALDSRVLNQIHALLTYLFAIVPVVAGADKFTNLLTHWENYLSPFVLRLLPFSAPTFMHIVGVIEIVAGILVFARPRLGGLVVTAWLLAIALQLILGGQFFDVAVRDIVMALAGSLTLARLTPLLSRNSRNTV
jgi:uncharacterized membrane protein HdeD (DUF308 family)